MNTDLEAYRAAYAQWFGTDLASMANIVVPVPEVDFEYSATLEGPNSLQLVISGRGIVRDSDHTTWLHFGAYEARQLAALLNGFADAAEAPTHSTEKE